ncbi:FIG00921845: hypothetical protein [hydrothermal vent metagenome]|uniref:Uncharacterized protein n=1 Tax=hydrothermal vent metagenome TaxID=652676 RepID=A0A3B0W2U8_9ZZZZ
MKKYILLILISISLPAQAHHVLGRPAYSLNEDSNTPPSMQVETQIGNYFVTYMVFPAFPKAGERGRVNLYATRIDNGSAYNGEVHFSVKDDVFFGNGQPETLGSQLPDDSVYRQGFVFSENGDYIITANFTDGDEPYTIDFPLRIGPPAAIGPIGIAVAIIVIILIVVNLIQRKRLLHSKIRNAHDETRTHDETRENNINSDKPS